MGLVMRYRVKDPKKRELVKELFGVEIVRSNFADTELRVDLSFAGHNFASNHLPVEQVPELEDGWNPFPQTKPEKDGRYLVASKCNEGDGKLYFADAANFALNSFDAFHSDIIAWREMPKIWKEQG